MNSIDNCIELSDNLFEKGSRILYTYRNSIRIEYTMYKFTKDITFKIGTVFYKKKSGVCMTVIILLKFSTDAFIWMRNAYPSICDRYNAEWVGDECVKFTYNIQINKTQMKLPISKAMLYVYRDIEDMYNTVYKLISTVKENVQ